MYRTTAAGAFRYANPALARMLGYTVDELLGMHMADIYVDPAAREALRAKSAPRGAVDGAEVEWRARDGRTMVVQLWCFAIDTDGGPCYEGTALDVTEVRRHREDRERTAMILDLVVRQMPAIYWVLDRELRITRTGGAIFDVLGYAPDRFIGQTLAAVHRTEPGSVDPIPYHYRALEGEHSHYDTEYRGKLL